MTAPIQIARASSEQLAEVAPLFAAYRQSYGQEHDLDGATAFLDARLRLGESVLFLARQGATAVGFVQLYPSYSSVAMRRLWILNDLFVAESARRQGVAAALIDQACRFARESGAVRLVLATAVGNRAAQALYQKLGWTRDDVFVHFKLEL